MFDGRISDQVGALLLSAHASCASSTLPSTWASYRSASSAAHEQSLGACSKQHTYPVPKSSHLHAASRCRTATSPSTTLCRYSSGLCLDPTALKSALAVALLPPPGFNLLRQFPRSIQTVQKRPIGRQLPYRLTTRSCLLSRATTAIIVGRRPVQYNHPEHTLDQPVFWALLQICQFEISLLLSLSLSRPFSLPHLAEFCYFLPGSLLFPTCIPDLPWLHKCRLDHSEVPRGFLRYLSPLMYGAATSAQP